MTIPLNTRDIFTLEIFTSQEYFERLRDSFAACVKAAENALEVFMRNLPADYRSRHVSLQPDAVWGELVLPNMRWALEGLNEAYIRISHGDLDGLGVAGNITTTFTGISREFVWDWMDSKNYFEYEAQWTVASKLASNISATVLGRWFDGDLSSLRGSPEPSNWPLYRINPSVTVSTGEKILRNGVYLPDIKGSCAQFLISGYKAKKASIPDPPPDPRITSAARKLFDTTWTLVERIADYGGNPGSIDGARLSIRCEAGQPCPRSGWWLTPSREDSRHKFSQGEIMPTSTGDYGMTIWQWDLNQND